MISDHRRWFTSNGKPVGKGRPRFVRATGRTYTPDRTREAEERLKRDYKAKYGNLPPFTGDIRLTVKAYFAIPKSATKDVHRRMAHGEIRPTIKPDLDNIIKLIADALNGIAYEDDKQIVQFGKSGKEYSVNPRVEVEIEELGDDE